MDQLVETITFGDPQQIAHTGPGKRPPDVNPLSGANRAPG